MSDSGNAVLEKLSQIEAKLNASHVLNGGFEKLVLDVRHTNEQIAEMKMSLEQMNTTINDPEEGVRSRVRDLEAESHRRWDFVQEAKAKIDHNVSQPAADDHCLSSNPIGQNSGRHGYHSVKNVEENQKHKDLQH